MAPNFPEPVPYPKSRPKPQKLKLSPRFREVHRLLYGPSLLLCLCPAAAMHSLAAVDLASACCSGKAPREAAIKPFRPSRTDYPRLERFCNGCKGS